MLAFPFRNDLTSLPVRTIPLPRCRGCGIRVERGLFRATDSSHPFDFICHLTACSSEKQLRAIR